MSNEGILGKMLKIAGAAAVVYAAYKIGQSSDKDKKNPQIIDIQREDVIENAEERYIVDLIDELNCKKNKTQKDKINIELLEVKLKQLRGVK